VLKRIAELNKKKHSRKPTAAELDRVQREIASANTEIDELVHELYGITDEERKIIEDG
jgi:hypothetical protein